MAKLKKKNEGEMTETRENEGKLTKTGGANTPR